MKYKLSALSGLKKKLDIHLSIEQVQKSFDEHYKKKQQKVHLPGFRKGKVPLNQVRALYQDEVSRDTSVSLVENFYLKAVKQEQLRPAGEIKIDFKSPCEEGQTFDFSIVLEVHPEINIDKSFKIQLSKPLVKVTEEEVDQYIEKIRIKSAKYVPVMQKKRVSWNDFVELRIMPSELKKSELLNKLAGEKETPQGIIGPDETDRKLLKEGKKLLLEVKKEQEVFPFKGLVEGVLGMQIGDRKKIPMVFFAKDSVKTQVGKPINLEVILMAIKKQVLPTDDDLVKFFKCKDIKELKKLGRVFLERTYRDEAYSTMKEQVLKQLVEKNPIPFLPERVVEEQKQSIISVVISSLKEKGLAEKEIEKYKKEQEKEFQEQARFMTHSSYLILTLARKLNISVSPQSVRNYMKTASMSNKPSDEEYERIENFLIREKTISHLIDTAEPA